MWQRLKNLFKKQEQKPLEERVISKDEKELREEIGDKWIKIKGSDDPALEAIINAAWHSEKPVMGHYDEEKGLILDS